MAQLGLIKKDPWLKPFENVISNRHFQFRNKLTELSSGSNSLIEFSSSFLYFGLHFEKDHWVFREWAPNANKIYLIGEFSDWKDNEEFRLNSVEEGNWEIKLPLNALHHGQQYKLHIYWPGGDGVRIPTHTNRVIQDNETLIFSAEVWKPENPYKWIKCICCYYPND